MSAPTTDRPTRIPDRERTAGRLLKSSARTSFDPRVDVDWHLELDPQKFYLPPERSSLYGTELWERLTHEQRVELTKHEIASIASVGIWFEVILMQMLIRHVYDEDVTTDHVKYGFIEIADECRHSTMFADMIEKFDCPAYGPGRVGQALGRWFKATANGTLTFAGALYVEEILDTMQREIMNDESLQEVSRQVSRIHVIEEARHISYAREESARQWAAMPWYLRARTRLVLGAMAYVATSRLVHPTVYRSVGLDPRDAAAVAAANPHWQQTKKDLAAKILGVFTELGLVRGPGRYFWRRAGLL